MFFRLRNSLNLSITGGYFFIPYDSRHGPGRRVRIMTEKREACGYIEENTAIVVF